MHIRSAFRHHHHRHRGDYEEERKEVEATYRSYRSYIRSKSLPLSTLIEIQKQKTDKEDVDIGKLRPALYDIFGEDAIPKVKKIMKLILSKLQKRIVHEISNEG